MFPDFPGDVTYFGQLKTVSVLITQQLITGDLNSGFAGCGLTFGFGAKGTNHSQRPLVKANLDIKNTGISADLFHVLYYVLNGGADRLRIEMPINNKIDSSFQGDAIWGTHFNLTTPDPLISNGDYITYRMTISFNHPQEIATISIEPIASNKNIALMSTQTAVWNYLGDVAATDTDTGEVRAGLAAGQGGASHPLSKEELLNSPVDFGFITNGSVKKCEFSDLKLTVPK